MPIPACTYPAAQDAALWAVLWTGCLVLFAALGLRAWLRRTLPPQQKVWEHTLRRLPCTPAALALASTSASPRA